MATAEDSDRSPGRGCRLCADSGVLSWQQPQFGVLRTIEMPCPAGCGEHWNHPRAESERIVDACEEAAVSHDGNVAAANRIGADFIRAALQGWGFYGPDEGRPKE